ncbi:MAG: T9SS type A sorting domain-containing protein [Flavobacterium sp.]|uniref:T9SS type A sorting domain-containing protein n=1 Tax=Flavobacterium sp. TaxID=239 RepID=UPI003266A2FF
MRNLYICIFLLLGICGFAQTPLEGDIKITPNGYFEDVFDQYGNKYNLKDLKAGEDKTINNTLSKSSAITCDSGIFELYFETGSGMEDTADANHNSRREVVCRVFKDLSDFINTPLKNAGNTTKVKIWVRNIANLQNVPLGTLGLATTFYTMPSNSAAGFGGIVDGEIYKTIQGGKNSYINTISPLVSSDYTNSYGNFYHGMVAFNFSNTIWNTNLLNISEANQYDLYSVVLHEVTHALGFNSLLNYDGKSLFGNNYKYYTQYDRFLKNNSGILGQFLITSSEACSSSSMYNYGFNSQFVSESELHPNCNLTPPTTNTTSNSTTCGTALKFVGTSTVPVYTPNCFEKGSSYSHFEDMCISPQNTFNDNYFVMSNVEGAGSNFMKRFLKQEEYNSLIDIGYGLNTTYGNNSIVLNSFKNYGGTVALGNNVSGINDGISNYNTISFIGYPNEIIQIRDILVNDYNASNFECLQDIYDVNATFSSTSGTSNTIINYTGLIPGFHLLRYVPVDNTGKKGNITYIYLYIIKNNNCSPVDNCNLVSNGNFEQFSTLPSSASQLDRTCNWNDVNRTTPDYFNRNGTAPFIRIPCNFEGSENDRLGLNGYTGMWVYSELDGSGKYSEIIGTKLSQALINSDDYQLSFDVSLAEGASASSIKFQAYLSDTAIYDIGYGEFTIPSSRQNMLFTNSTFSTITNGWERITFKIPKEIINSEKYLYLGGINNVSYNQITPVIQVVGCSYNQTNTTGVRKTYYYIDNVKLIPLNGANFDLPSTICSNQTLSNLSNYLSATSINGVFTASGAGITNTGGIYSFSAVTAGVGTHTITYTYANSSDCSIAMSDTIQVVNTNTIMPTFTQIAPICLGGNLQPLPTTSNNGITGSWSPALNSTVTTTYTFNATTGQCASSTSTTMTITVLSANDPSCSTGVCQPNLTLSTPESASVVHKTVNWIETNTNYTTLPAQNISMKAGDYIYLKSGTYINATYLGRIEICTATSKIGTITTFDELVLDEKITVYPNPVADRVIISSVNTNLKTIFISTVDGKTFYIKNDVNRDILEINTSKWKKGIYIINIETDNGNIFRKKLIKN